MRWSGLIYSWKVTFTRVRPPRRFVYLKFKPVPKEL
jgi:hypothetical protein